MRHSGWIGLGKMGAPMALNLAEAGHALSVYNRSAGKAKALADAGAVVARSPADAATDAQVTFCMLADDAALRHTLLGAKGAITAMPKGAVLTEMSTVSPEVSGEIAQACLAQGVGYIRAPVSGSVAFAATAKLTFFASGPRDVYEEVLPLLKLMSAQQFHVGDACEARVLKLVMNMMVGTTAAMLGEAMALGLKHGLERARLLEVIGASVAASPLVGYKMAALKAQDYTPAFEARMMSKDFDLMLDAAARSGTPMPLTAEVSKGWNEMIALGDGDQDFFKFIELAASRAGLDDEG